MELDAYSPELIGATSTGTAHTSMCEERAL